MKKYCLALLAVAAALAITQSASATTINGQVGVTGFDASWTANSVTFSVPLGLAGGGTGSFTGTSGIADLTGFSFVLPTSPDGVVLFDVISGTNSPITMTITGPITVQEDTNSELEITGFGTLTEKGFTNSPSPDNFILQINDASGHNGDKSSTLAITAFVPAPNIMTPEPGSFLLLGTGLLGLAFLASRKAKAARRGIVSM